VREPPFFTLGWIVNGNGFHNSTLSPKVPTQIGRALLPKDRYSRLTSVPRPSSNIWASKYWAIG
jgi:hypothetical protein